jgi:hypothetical protein
MQDIEWATPLVLPGQNKLAFPVFNDPAYAAYMAANPSHLIPSYPPSASLSQQDQHGSKELLPQQAVSARAASGSASGFSSALGSPQCHYPLLAQEMEMRAQKDAKPRRGPPSEMLHKASENKDAKLTDPSSSTRSRSPSNGSSVRRRLIASQAPRTYFSLSLLRDALPACMLSVLMNSATPFL